MVGAAGAARAAVLAWVGLLSRLAVNSSPNREDLPWEVIIGARAPGGGRAALLLRGYRWEGALDGGAGRGRRGALSCVAVCACCVGSVDHAQVNGTITGLDRVTEENTKGTPWLLLYCDVEWADVLEMPVTTYEECEAKRKVAREGEKLLTGWVPTGGSTGVYWKDPTGFDMQ